MDALAQGLLLKDAVLTAQGKQLEASRCKFVSKLSQLISRSPKNRGNGGGGGGGGGGQRRSRERDNNRRGRY